MIDKEIEAEILRLFTAERWPVNSIAAQLRVHHGTVSRVIDQAGLPRPRIQRESKVDPFLDFIDQMLERYPAICASRIYCMCVDRGYTGSQSHFRRIVSKRRPRKTPEAFRRLRMLPAEQAQVDWGYFGKISIGKAERRVLAFVMVLAYSRMISVRFFLGECQENFFRGHVAAFRDFGGVPRTVLYDNLKSAVIERRLNAIRFNSKLLDLARHYSFQPRAAGVARGNEKGRVERAIRYLRTSFFAGREWRDLQDLNAQVLAWCDDVATQRSWPEDRSRTVAEVFEAEERSKLIALPGDDFACEERVEVTIGKTPYARFDLNDYSVPARCVRSQLTIFATLEELRIFDSSDLVATHPRSFDRGVQIEDPEHLAELENKKRRGRSHGGMQKLLQAAPSAEQLLHRVAESGDNVGSAVSWMLRLLAQFGGNRLELATTEAISKGTPHPQAVRHILDRKSREEGRLPSTPVHLPDDPRVRDVLVKSHDLAGYDQLAKPAEPEEAGAPEEAEDADE